jgi:hypothetical protein
MVDGERIPVRMNGDEAHLIAHDAETGRAVDVETVELHWPVLGMRNCRDARTAIFCTKRACRQYRRGPKQSNIDVLTLDDRGVRRGRSAYVFEFGGKELFDPTYPTAGLAERMFKNGWKAVALSNEVALSCGGLVYYKRWPVGRYKDGFIAWRDNATPMARRACNKVLSILE